MKSWIIAIAACILVGTSSSSSYDVDKTEDWEVVEQSIDVEFSEVNSTDDGEADTPGESSRLNKDTPAYRGGHQDGSAQHRQQDIKDVDVDGFDSTWDEKRSASDDRIDDDPSGPYQDVPLADIEKGHPKYEVKDYFIRAGLPKGKEIKEIEGKMKNGTVLVLFIKPSYLDVVDSRSADLIFTTKSLIPYKNLFFELLIQFGDDEPYKVPNIAASTVRNHGTHRMIKPKPGSYFVTARAYTEKNGERMFLGEGVTFFFVHESIYSERLSQAFIGLADKQTGQLKRLDREKLKSGRRQIGWVRDEENEVDEWRLDIYTVERGTFSRIIIKENVNDQIDNERAKQRKAGLMENEKQMSDALSDTMSIKDDEDVDYSDSIPLVPKDAEPQRGQDKCHVAYHNFFPKSKNVVDKVRPAVTYIMMTGWKRDEKGSAMLVEWGRATVYGYWGKVLKNFALTLAIAAFIAVDVALNYGALGAFRALSTLATKGFVFLKVEGALWGSDDCVFH